ncbi:HU family DNA-binding protein [uncultured Roseobacter sp.]|uniref:HU family DNA-binding protein n=1 Tax=uncultured Roseobacter sp. TaxID=114847 RepID=UPI00262093D4|nr:HU family DNA-binding protein [uncultured Roseobacter sp.]
MSTTKTTAKRTTARAAAKPRKTAPKTTASPKTKAKMSVAKTPLATAPAKPESTSATLVNPMRKKELVDKVVARAGIKKKDAKLVVEAMLAELGEALAEGRPLVLPPFGRVRINREKKLANGRVIIAKVRQTDQPLRPGDQAETEKP